MAGKLNGKVALVTGGSRGIGKAIAVALAEEGADIVIAARTVERKDWIPGTLGDTQSAIEALGRRALAVRADLSDRADLDNLVRQSLETCGKVDILVNNAAFMGRATYDSAWDLSVKGWDLQWAVNLTAPFLLCRALAPQMRDRGGGLILNITSAAAESNSPHPGVVYGPSKAAMDRLTELLAGQYRAASIAVIALQPGFTRTEIAEIGAAGAGLSAEDAHPVELPARAAAYLLTCEDPMRYSGQIVQAVDLAREKNLI
jgi:NAD(P)-dependent dehydrogenase (short-subunit alcohol dehydrogenase family)